MMKQCIFLSNPIRLFLVISCSIQKQKHPLNEQAQHFSPHFYSQLHVRLRFLSIFFSQIHNKTHSTTCVDPLLAGVFYNSGVLVQSCLIVVFFVMRSLYEYFIDSVTSKHFGSDGMPIINFACTYRILSFSLRRSKT